MVFHVLNWHNIAMNNKPHFEVIKFFILAMILSLGLGGLGSYLGLDRSLIVVLYSGGVGIPALILGRKKLNFKMDWKRSVWLLFAFLLPLFYIRVPSFIANGGDLNFVGTSLSVVVSIFVAAFLEELGWRGYLFEKLKSMSWFKMNLIIGLMWAIWHFPVIFMGSYYVGDSWIISVPVFTLNLVLLSFVFGGLRKISGGIWAAVVAHAVHNLVYKIVPGAALEGSLFLTGGLLISVGILIYLEKYDKAKS